LTRWHAIASNREHKKFKEKVGTSTWEWMALWLGDKHVLVAKYFEREAKTTN